MGKRIKPREIIWDKRALADFISILDFIKLDSPTNAKRVRTRILNIIQSIPENPEMFREDELRINNDGTYRVFNKFNIRVSYKIETASIIITRIRHSKQEPLNF